VTAAVLARRKQGQGTAGICIKTWGATGANTRLPRGSIESVLKPIFSAAFTAPWRRRILRGALAVCCALLCAIGGVRADDPYVTFKLKLDAPLLMTEDLRQSLDLQRWQDYDKLTPELLERLAAEAADQLRDILATRGYFTPTVTHAMEENDGARTVRLTVEPGEPAKVSAVEIRFTGAIASGDAIDAALMGRVRKEWMLPAGATFVQTDWERAKREVVNTVRSQRYAGAELTASAAEVDPQAQRVTLTLEIDSGAVLRFGELQISGLSKYDASMVRNLWTVESGAVYDREALNRFERRLVSTQYFASLQVSVDAAAAQDGVVPVRVNVIEAPEKRITLGLNYSTDTQFGGSADYRDNNFLGRGWRLRMLGNLDTRIQSGEANIELPEHSAGWSDKIGARLRHTDIENLETRETLLRARRTAIDERSQPSFGVTASFAQQSATTTVADNVYATLFDYGHTWRNTDSLLSPRHGAMLYGEVGYAPAALSTRNFGRLIGRAAWYHQLGPRDDLVLRGEAGWVISDSTEGVPQSMLFRTGGATSVRGYNFESLGVKQNNTVFGARSLIVSSAEYIHWILSDIGIAAFIDAGNAGDDVRSLHPALGYGLGARIKSPVGPFRLDLAYGRDDRTVRLHFSAGVSF